MIRALAFDREGKPIVLLGLARENMRRLAEREPIRVNLRNLGGDERAIAELPDLDVVVFFADVETTAELLGAVTHLRPSTS